MIGDRVDVNFDVLGWTEEERRRAGYAAKGPLLAARIVEAREDGSRVCSIEGLPHPEHECEVAERVGYGDVVLADPREADYAESVLFSRRIRLLPVSDDVDGET